MQAKHLLKWQNMHRRESNSSEKFLRLMSKLSEICGFSKNRQQRSCFAWGAYTITGAEERDSFSDHRLAPLKNLWNICHVFQWIRDKTPHNAVNWNYLRFVVQSLFIIITARFKKHRILKVGSSVFLGIIKAYSLKLSVGERTK